MMYYYQTYDYNMLSRSIFRPPDWKSAALSFVYKRRELRYELRLHV